MKLKNIFMAGAAAMMLASCNDYLDVDAPSAYTTDFVYGDSTEIERALNGVYAQALVNNLYGRYYQSTFQYNTDVDFGASSSNAHAHNTYSRYDCDDQGGEIYSFWTAAYSLIEYANKFINNAQNSSFYANGNTNVLQMIGEAKCLRAMAYHDLVVMWGDVPFTFTPTASLGSDFVIPIFDRQVIQDSLIADLKDASKYMKFSTEIDNGVERCSKDFAWAMIARIALTAGGYSLRPNTSDAKSYGTMERPSDYIKYYKIVKDYTDSVINSKTHNLGQSYQEVFVNECNYNVVNNDDVIFELPFAKDASGYTGYAQGPTYNAYESNTVGPWGACNGGTRVNAFYRFLFQENDKRREFVNGLWYYSYYTTSSGSLADTVYIRNDYSVHNNKWSKLWTDESNALGTDKTSNTGINYPYMRYADVLLMNAEAENEINGPTESAKKNLIAVRERAFSSDLDIYNFEASTKEDFQKTILRERMYEFAGENMRWRDLVRTNTISEELMYSFLRYYSAGMINAGSASGFEDAINEHDRFNNNLEEGYIDNLPERIYYHAYRLSDGEPSAVGLKAFGSQLYGCIVNSGEIEQKYPNQSLKSLRIYNAYKTAQQPMPALTIKIGGFKATSWNYADFYQWGDADSGTPKDQCKYSFYGFIRADDSGNIWIVRNGTLEPFSVIPSNISSLPVVRYILPYPNLAIQRSAGEYKNYYGY